MERLITRSARQTVALCMATAVVPLFILLLWVSGRPDIVDAWLVRPGWLRAVDLCVLLAAVNLATGFVAFAVARRSSRPITASMDELVRQAAQLGAGETTVSSMATGVDEVDRVSEAISLSAQRLGQLLSTERGFAADASHQLRTPLTALLMRLEEVAATDDLDVAHEEAAVAIAQVERMSRVVIELLERRRSDPEGHPPEVSLDTVIATLQREWQPAFETARRSVRVHGERGLVVRATPVALNQILSTLLENSLVHGRGTVDVQARRSGPSAVVEVRDEGDGIEAALAPHIFERSVSSGRGSSNGLGLALARDLAESCGGRLDLIARTPATFALFLSEAKQGWEPTPGAR
ncbi:MAG: HAMP domain-containing sensor histidine kinase [Candidatus Phosphoribacter sp.]|nr:HAMP domain-containing histidine kinase [Actinomycetales bacterium]